MEISTAGVWVSLVGLIVDLAWREYLISATDALIGLGCALSVLLMRGRGERGRFPWVPIYLGAWLALFPTMFRSGILSGPFFGAHLILLFMGGVTLQTRFSCNRIFTFCMANLFMAAVFSPFQGTPAPFNSTFIALRYSLMLGGVLVLARAYLLAEDVLIKDSLDKSEQLTEAEGHLTHAERMAEVGNLVATTAHELAQPIQVISASASLLVKLIPDDPAGGASSGSTRGAVSTSHIKELVSRIEVASMRLRRLLTQLRDFSRKDPFQLQTVDLNEIARSVLLLTQHDFRVKNVEFRAQLTDAPAWTRGDPLRLQQVLFNLLNNARDAAVASTQPQVELSITEQAHWIRIVVRNTGPGIPLPVQAKIFRPYFTTKDKGKGTGLGLSICAQLVEQHNGRIFFSSEENNTVFVVDLRKGQAATMMAPPAPLTGASSGGASGTPLVAKAKFEGAV